MNLYLNKRIDRTYLDAVLWRHKYPYVIVHPLPALPMYTRAHRETPRPSSTLHSNKGPRVFISSALGGCAGRIISSKATDFQAVKCPSRIYQQY